MLSPVDTMFIRMESQRTPMHIGGLLTFTLPDGAGDEFTRDLHRSFSQLQFLPHPFNSVVSGTVLPEWKPVEPDPEYHVRLSALPQPGTDVQLAELVARLHGNPLDLTRPLWEAHIIEGLSGHRFAMYFKAHHCAVDGMGAVNTIKKWLSTDPDRYEPMPTVAPPSEDSPGMATKVATTSVSRVANGLTASGEIARKLVGMGRGANSSVRAALNTPRTPFNTKLTQHRRLAVQELELPRLKAVATATGTTVNDVTLAACGGAVRRYLMEFGELPDKSLMASVPVGWDRDEDTLNAATGFVCPLATTESDVLKRLAIINNATSRGKRELLAMSPNALEHYTLIGLLPLAVGQRTGALTMIPPLFNFTVSNVVLSKQPLYLHGARLDWVAPMSFLCDGYGLNITLVGYTDKVVLGFVGCRDTIPHLQKLAVYAGEALTELEQAITSS
nr:wax ester/triacylglycerol synthase family O-acyltransferase [Antrihabitans stalactiti]